MSSQNMVELGCFALNKPHFWLCNEASRKKYLNKLRTAVLKWRFYFEVTARMHLPPSR